jgi:hypothetical protein
MRYTRLFIAAAMSLAQASATFAQYGKSNNQNAGKNTNADPRHAKDTGRGTGTSTDDETDAQREARQERGMEEPVNKGMPPGIANGPQTVGKTEEGNWGKLTPEQQKAAVEELKKFAEETKSKVDGNLVLDETKYFLFYSDLKPAEATKWAGTLDQMYARLAALFAVKGGENIFRGKALVFVFAKEQDYLTFQKEMHDTDATGSAGLCHNFGNGDVHIAFYRQPNDLDFEAVLVHESVHGFLHRYRKPPTIPTWANEGLAETVASQFVSQRGKRQELRQYAISQLRERGSLGDNFFKGDRLEGWQYPVAQMVTELLIKDNKKNYVAFIDAIKDGAKWEDALQQKVGATPEQLTVALGETLRIRGLGSTADAQLDPRKVQGGPEHDPQGQNEDNANSRNRNRQQ